MDPAAADAAASPDARAAAVVAELEAAADPAFRADMDLRYGIHTDHAVGVRMSRMKALAKRLGTDHDLAAALWATGLYEARIVASLVDDPDQVTGEQMDAWCHDFDNWAIVDSTCFNLFDRAPAAWEKVDQWATSNEEWVKRAGFALLWSLANHDRDAPESRFLAGLGLIERTGGDGRPLVDKAIGMALRAIGKRRASVRAEALAVAERLASAEDAAARRIGRPAARELRQA
jgi:3-methyladenine DNA glycosylase AlkD